MKDDAIFGLRRIVLLCLCITSHVCAQQGAYPAYVRSFDKSRPFQETVYDARQALAGALAEHNDSLVCLARIQLGILLWNDGEFADAENSLLQGRQIAEHFQRWKDVAKATHYMGLVKYYTCDFADALRLYDTAELRYRKLRLDSAVAKIKSHKGLIFNVQGNYAAATQNMIESFRLQETMPGYRDQSISMQFPSTAAEKIYFESKLEKDFESLEFLKNTRDRNKLAFTLFNISRDFYYLKKYDSAIRYQKESAEISLQLGIDPFWSSLGEFFSAKGEYDSALYYYMAQLKLIQASGTQIHRSALLKNLAELYIKKSDWAEAERYLDQATHLNRDLGLKRSLANCLMTKASILTKRGHPEGALVDIENALSISKEIGCIKDTYECLAKKSDILRSVGRETEALVALHTSMRLKDSVANGEHQFRVTQLQLEYDSDKKTRDLASLRVQNDLKQVELENKNLVILIVAIGAGSVCILLVLLFSRMRQRAKNAQLLAQKNKLMEEKNELLERQARQKEVLLHEVHHRVKNNLQIISSLISLKSRNASTETNEALLQLGNRIFTMGLIHEKLYATEEVQSVRLDTYLIELINHLLFTFNGHEDEVKAEMRCDEVEIGVDRALACGLICNELITNSLKYAFGAHEGSRKIAMKLTQTAGSIEWTLSDNGSAGANALPNHGNSFGLRFVEQLVRSKLEGSWSVKRENGFNVTIQMPVSV